VQTIAALFAAGGLLAAPAWASDQRANLRTDWNNSPDPDGYYGGCQPNYSAYRWKKQIVTAAHVATNGVIALAVLSCKAFGGGGAAQVPCPSGTPFDACVRAGNDGQGNDILLGVLRRSALTDPNNGYGPCPGGPTLTKVATVIAAGKDPRLVDGVVTLKCSNATTGAGAAKVAQCPSNPGNIYAYCIVNPNDGLGNSVTLGVVGANGAADPYTLYGECAGASLGVHAGFRPKLLLANGLAPLNGIRRIQILSCAPAASSPGPLRRIPWSTCSAPPYDFGQTDQFEFCIIGTDPNGNGVYAGVSTR
jgi:hypothetical protein